MPPLKSVAVPAKIPVILEPIAEFSNNLINESSGLIKSRQYSNVIWTHNDSGDSARIFAVQLDGNDKCPPGTDITQGIEIASAVNRDWEDITIDDNNNLIIADCGNNDSSRQDLCIYVLPEADPDQSTIAEAIIKYDFKYPDQNEFPPPFDKSNFDCEAIFFTQGKLYLLTKHRGDKCTKLYRFNSLKQNESNIPELIAFFNSNGQITSVDALFSGQVMAILTYTAIWVFEDYPEDNFFDGTVLWLPIAAEQCEAICFLNDQELLISNEQ